MEEFINLTLLVAEGQDELSQIFSSRAVEAQTKSLIYLIPTTTILVIIIIIVITAAY